MHSDRLVVHSFRILNLQFFVLLIHGSIRHVRLVSQFGHRLPMFYDRKQVLHFAFDIPRPSSSAQFGVNGKHGSRPGVLSTRILRSVTR